MSKSQQSSEQILGDFMQSVNRVLQKPTSPLSHTGIQAVVEAVQDPLTREVVDPNQMLMMTIAALAEATRYGMLRLSLAQAGVELLTQEDLNLALGLQVNSLRTVAQHIIVVQRQKEQIINHVENQMRHQEKELSARLLHPDKFFAKALPARDPFLENQKTQAEETIKRIAPVLQQTIDLGVKFLASSSSAIDPADKFGLAALLIEVMQGQKEETRNVIEDILLNANHDPKITAKVPEGFLYEGLIVAIEPPATKRHQAAKDLVRKKVIQQAKGNIPKALRLLDQVAALDTGNGILRNLVNEERALFYSPVQFVLELVKRDPHPESVISGVRQDFIANFRQNKRNRQPGSKSASPR